MIDFLYARQQLYHGSAVPDLRELLPLSVLHGSDEKVVYLSSSIPYTLLYIWDGEKTQYSHKWVTGWVKDGIAYYEEQFPGQLKAFYAGVRGYVYSVLKSGGCSFPPTPGGSVLQQKSNPHVPCHGDPGCVSSPAGT